MNRHGFILVVWVLLLLSGMAAAQQKAPHVAELDFVRDLRARRYTDLALEYLERLKKNNATPELLQELPLELAKTRLEAAADEADSGKRLAIYEQARGEIDAFLKANDKHARAGEARLDIAQVAVLRGKTQLSRALIQDNLEARVAEGVKAREMLVEAGNRLKEVAANIDAKLQPQANLSLALNVFDEAQTYLDEGKDQVLVERGKKIQEAAKLLEKLVGGDSNSPVTWQAAAWLGRCYQETGEPKKARAKYAEILLSTAPVANDGKRLARYFRLLVIKDSPEPDEAKDAKFVATIITEAVSWLGAYPSYLNTPEGYGIRYLLAQALQLQAENPKTLAPQRAVDLANARKLLKAVEQTENDFTDRARRLKIGLMREQKLFDKEIPTLTTFEDCYVRAQFEIIMMSEDAKPPKDGAKPDAAKIEEMRKVRATKIVTALERGLTLPDAKPNPKGKPNAELNNARAMLAFYCLNQQKYADAIRHGEAFARDDPRSSQAAMAAVYALQSYAQQLGKRERDAALPEELRPERDKMLSLAHYMEERWPKELAGDMARHQIGLILLREKKQAKETADQARLLGEALAKLGAISRSYASYIVAQYQLADACLEAERDKLEPGPGEKAGAYRLRALAVLSAVPEPDVAADPIVGQVYVMAKGKLGWELFKDKQFQPMFDLSEGLIQKLPALPMEADVRQQMLANVTDLRLFATGGLAEAEFGKGQYAAVALRLDPLVVALNAPEAPENKTLAAQLKKNLQLGSALMSMDLRANVQLGKLDQVELVLRALQALTAEGDDKGGTAKILQTLVYLIKQQIDELDKKGDQENRAKAVTGFTKILDKVAEKPDKLETNSRMLLAQCYGNMGEHKKAAGLLEPIATPTEKGAQLLYARELRQAKEVDKARRLVDEITKGAGWGARNIDALLEDVALLEEEGKYGPAAIKADKLVKQMLPNITKDNNIKEKYFEAYFHVVYSFVKHGQAQPDSAKKDENLKRAALQTIDLEKKWPNFGGDASAKRFNDLLNKEADFKAAVEQLKSKSN